MSTLHLEKSGPAIAFTKIEEKMVIYFKKVTFGGRVPLESNRTGVEVLVFRGKTGKNRFRKIRSRFRHLEKKSSYNKKNYNPAHPSQITVVNAVRFFSDECVWFLYGISGFIKNNRKSASGRLNVTPSSVPKKVYVAAKPSS